MILDKRPVIGYNDRQANAMKGRKTVVRPLREPVDGANRRAAPLWMTGPRAARPNGKDL